MKDEYMLTIDEVRDLFVMASKQSLEAAEADFDRCLADHDRRVAAKALADLLTPESLEAARLRVEDELVEWRDSRMSMVRGPGLVIAEKDGSPSHIVRMGFEKAFELVIRNRAAAFASEPGTPEGRDNKL